MNFNFNFPKGGWGFVAALFLICLILFWTGKSASALTVIFLGGLVLAGYNLTFNSHDSLWWIILVVCLVLLLVFAVGFAPSEWQTLRI